MPGEITELLEAYGRGDADAMRRLMSLVYEELRRLAAHYLRAERPGHTLQPTALVHEAFIRLVERPEVNWRDRAHFFAAAACVMRHVLVDHARARRSAKREGERRRVALEDTLLVPQRRELDLLRLDDALRDLERLDPMQSRIVELRFFGGLSVEETAEVVGRSAASVKRDWAMARAWLRVQLTGGGEP